MFQSNINKLPDSKNRSIDFFCASEAYVSLKWVKSLSDIGQLSLQTRFIFSTSITNNVPMVGTIFQYLKNIMKASDFGHNFYLKN